MSKTKRKKVEGEEETERQSHECGKIQLVWRTVVTFLGKFNSCNAKHVKVFIRNDRRQ